MRKPIEEDKFIKLLFKKNLKALEDVKILWNKEKKTWLSIEIESDDILTDILQRYTIKGFNVATFVINLARDFELL